MIEKIPTPEAEIMSPEAIKEIMSEMLEKVSEEDTDVTIVNEFGLSQNDVSEAIKQKYTEEILSRSKSWHAFAMSSMQEGTDTLPDDKELEIATLITEYINDKLKPLVKRVS